MQKIVLSDILPEIFAGSSLQSDVWQTDVEFDKGRKYLVQADSGKGKSSLFGYVYGYRSDFEGKIFFDTTDIIAIDDKHWDSIRKLSLSILFQDLKIFPELTAWENIQLKNKLTHHKSDSDIRRLLNRLEIADKADKLCEKLSWGQQQRVAIVRAVCQPFDFILLDEPISHIDDRMAAVVTDIITEEADRQKAGVVVSSIGKSLPLRYDTTLNL